MKHITVAAAVFIRDGKVFAAQRKDAGELARTWEFPGGKLEPGESGEQAIVREIKEELSADIRVVEYITTVEHQYQTFFITMHAYLCEIVSGSLVLSEHIDSRWLSKRNVYSVAWAAADVPIVKAIEPMLED
jgi:8-oxo-dGTP diphosphatase